MKIISVVGARPNFIGKVIPMGENCSFYCRERLKFKGKGFGIGK